MVACLLATKTPYRFQEPGVGGAASGKIYTKRVTKKVATQAPSSPSPLQVRPRADALLFAETDNTPLGLGEDGYRAEPRYKCMWCPALSASNAPISHGPICTYTDDMAEITLLWRIPAQGRGVTEVAGAGKVGKLALDELSRAPFLMKSSLFPMKYHEYICCGGKTNGKCPSFACSSSQLRNFAASHHPILDRLDSAIHKLGDRSTTRQHHLVISDRRQSLALPLPCLESSTLLSGPAPSNTAPTVLVSFVRSEIP